MSKRNKSQEEPAQGSNPTGAKANKTTPVFIYLAILFAAAFLMLLLAYFIQLRNSENTIDDLRTSMTATREELMAENHQLREENQQLQEEKEALEGQAEDLGGQVKALYGEIGELKEQHLEELGQYMDANKTLSASASSWADLWRLERSFQEKDYEDCAEFFRGAMVTNYYMTPPEAAERVEEIHSALIKMGKLDAETPLPLVADANEDEPAESEAP